MGLLQLAGVVSGGGKALQQGLQQTQQYLSQSMLLKERDDMERARMDITYGREVGMLQMRNKLEMERDERQHSRALDLAEQREDFETRKGRIERNAAREDATTQFERQKDRDVTSKVLDASYDQQKEATRSKEDRAKEARERQAKREELQTNTGARLVEKMLENQRPSAGSASGAAGKLDPNVSATLKVYDQELKDLGDELNNVMTKPDRAAAIQKRMEVIRNEQFKLLGRSRGEDKPARKPIIFPE